MKHPEKKVIHYIDLLILWWDNQSCKFSSWQSLCTLRRYRFFFSRIASIFYGHQSRHFNNKIVLEQITLMIQSPTEVSKEFLNYAIKVYSREHTNWVGYFYFTRQRQNTSLRRRPLFATCIRSFHVCKKWPNIFVLLICFSIHRLWCFFTEAI